VRWVFGKLNIPTAEFELFDNVADLLKPVSVALLFALRVGDHLHLQNDKNDFQFLTSEFGSCCGRGSSCSYQEGGSLKQKNFICLYDLCKIPQVRLQLLDVWDELINYAGPGLQGHFIMLFTNNSSIYMDTKTHHQRANRINPR